METVITLVHFGRGFVQRTESFEESFISFTIYCVIHNQIAASFQCQCFCINAHNTTNVPGSVKFIVPCGSCYNPLWALCPRVVSGHCESRQLLQPCFFLNTNYFLLFSISLNRTHFRSADFLSSPNICAASLRVSKCFPKFSRHGHLCKHSKFLSRFLWLNNSGGNDSVAKDSITNSCLQHTFPSYRVDLSLVKKMCSFPVYTVTRLHVL